MFTNSVARQIGIGIFLAVSISGCSVVPTPGNEGASETSSASIQVSNVTECGGDDGSTWYWAPCFSVNLEPFTKMTCKVDALDADGQTVATMTNTFNTLNDGTVTGYGEGAGTQDVSEELYKSIKSLEVSCDL